MSGLRNKGQFTPTALKNVTLKVKYYQVLNTLPSEGGATKLLLKFVFKCQTYLSQPMTNGCIKRGEVI